MDDVFSLWDISKPDIETFIKKANLYHPTSKFTAEISDTETAFLDTTVYKGARFRDQSTLDVKTPFQRRPSNTHISPLVTRQACKTDSSKVRPYESFEQTPQRTLSRKTFRNLKDICGTEVTHAIR